MIVFIAGEKRGGKMKRNLFLQLMLVGLFFACAALLFAVLPELFHVVRAEEGAPVSSLAGEPLPPEREIISAERELHPPKPASSREDAPPSPEGESSPAVSEPAPQGESGSAPEPASSPSAAPEPPVSSSPAEPPPESESAAPLPPYTPPQNLPIPEGEEKWALRLVNWQNPLPMDFAPEYEEVQNHFVMDKRVAPIARRMILDAWDQGVTLVVNSGYRPYSAQQTVYNNRYQKYLAEGRTEEEARRLTDSYVAIPGYSEHQLGLALDIVAVQDSPTAITWLADHAQDYGFILRYPEDKTAITRTAYESWHYRYVGIAAAQEIKERGLCLEEYLAER